MLPTDAWRAHLPRVRKRALHSTSFEYEFESKRSFRSFATPPSRSSSHQTSSPAAFQVFEGSDLIFDRFYPDFVAESPPSKNLFAKFIAHLYSFSWATVHAIFRLFLYILWTFLRLVDGILLQRIRAIALRLFGFLFCITFVGLLLFVILDLASSMNVISGFSLPESPATSIAAPRSDEKPARSPLLVDWVRTHGINDEEAPSAAVSLQGALSTLSLYHERTRDEVKGLRAHAQRQSTLTNEVIASHAAASLELNILKRDLDALQLLHAAEVASRAAASLEISILKRDLETLRLVVEAFKPLQDAAGPDFALHSTGASVIPSLTSETYALRQSTLPGKILSYFTGIGVLPGRPPVTALHYDIHDGHCWPFPGSHGQLGIALSSPVYVEAITIDHVATAVAVGRRTSAPKDMEVWAMVEGQANVAKLEAWRAGMTQAHEPAHHKLIPKSPEYIRIAALQYDVHSPNYIQTFPVDAEIKSLGIDFGVVVLVINSNWGMDEYTCLYRIRVHGRKMDP